MKKEFIQGRIRDQIVVELKNGTPIAELKDLANKILELCQRHGGDHIPNTELLEVLNEYPALTTDLVEVIKKEDKYATEKTLEALRRGLKSKMS